MKDMDFTVKEVVGIVVFTLALLYVLNNIWYPPYLWLPFYEFLPAYFQNTAPAKWIIVEISTIPFYFTLIAVIFVVTIKWRK